LSSVDPNQPRTTQEAHPWRATARTVFQFVVALAALLPLIAEELPPAPWLLAVVAVAGTATRVMALPAVQTFLERFAPWLSAR